MRSVYTFIRSPEHIYPDHPESPERMEILERKLSTFEAELLQASPATYEQVAAVHHAKMIGSIEQACKAGPGIIDYAPTYVTSSSFQDALLAAGGVLTCTKAVMSGDARNAFAIGRPPGHHAEPGRAMGFCIFNNVAIGAREALASGLERVMIVDFDAHHGNGTQAIFLDDPRLTFISMHQWGIYPGSGWIDEVPHARQRIINVPLNARAGDMTYGRVIEEVVKSAAKKFNPQLIFASAGFDSHWSDPITSLGLSSAGFFWISKMLVEMAEEHCNGRIIFVLEGGYDPVNLANGASAVFLALKGNSSAPDVQDACPYPDPDHSKRIDEVLRWHGMTAG
jgi:acetoin utilization deacetylase AcuC-like enzyme